MTEYYACLKRYEKGDNFTFLYGEFGTGNSNKLSVVTSVTRAEAEFIFRIAFPAMRSHKKEIVDITHLVESGIIPMEKLEILEVIVRRSS